MTEPGNPHMRGKSYLKVENKEPDNLDWLDCFDESSSSRNDGPFCQRIINLSMGQRTRFAAMLLALRGNLARLAIENGGSLQVEGLLLSHIGKQAVGVLMPTHWHHMHGLGIGNCCQYLLLDRF